MLEILRLMIAAPIPRADLGSPRSNILFVLIIEKFPSICCLAP